MVRVCNSNIVCASVRPCIRPFVCHTISSNHRAELNQTCYITFPHGKGFATATFFRRSVNPCTRRPSICLSRYLFLKKVKENSRESHNHKPQPFPDTKRKRKRTNPNKYESIKRTKSTKISSLFPKQC